MNKDERKLMVFCMDFIAHQFNDETDFIDWIETGVADGDNGNYQNMVSCPDIVRDCVDDYYLSDEVFADLMHQFLRICRDAHRNGGLYCDGVIDMKMEYIR